MAVNKIITSHAGTKGAMRNCIEYALRDTKVQDGYVAVTGPYQYDEITWDKVNRAFNEEKEIWNKTGGRDYLHSIISFHKDENITHEQALQFGKDIAENDPFYKDFQTLIAVHQDRDHVHIHFVSNSVSYVDGHKEHHTANETRALMQRTNEKCEREGYTVCKEGLHFDGSEIEEGEVTSFNKDLYNLLNDEAKNSFVAECGLATLAAIENSNSREEFISNMNQMGWSVYWEDKRTHITFSNSDGKKVRDTALQKNFHIKCDKETLNHEFERKTGEIQIDEFRRELDSTIARTGIDSKASDCNQRIGRETRTISIRH